MSAGALYASAGAQPAALTDIAEESRQSRAEAAWSSLQAAARRTRAAELQLSAPRCWLRRGRDGGKALASATLRLTR
jgi:hypothetical protein